MNKNALLLTNQTILALDIEHTLKRLSLTLHKATTIKQAEEKLNTLPVELFIHDLDFYSSETFLQKLLSFNKPIIFLSSIPVNLIQQNIQYPDSLFVDKPFHAGLLIDFIQNKIQRSN